LVGKDKIIRKHSTLAEGMNISAHKFCCKMNYRFIDLLPDVRMMDILSKKRARLEEARQQSSDNNFYKKK
jgi:mannose/fructose-specific phosphotransferase system component IIA